MSNQQANSQQTSDQKVSETTKNQQKRPLNNGRPDKTDQ